VDVDESAPFSAEVFDGQGMGRFGGEVDGSHEGAELPAVGSGAFAVAFVNDEVGQFVGEGRSELVGVFAEESGVEFDDALVQQSPAERRCEAAVVNDADGSGQGGGVPGEGEVLEDRLEIPGVCEWMYRVGLLCVHAASALSTSIPGGQGAANARIRNGRLGRSSCESRIASRSFGAYNPGMRFDHAMTAAARQLLAIEELLGNTDFLYRSSAELPKVPSVPALPPVGRVEAAERLPAGDKPALLEAMDQDEVRGCTKCVLSQTRANTVFGEGSPDAELVFVGEGPGADEDASGRPFVGRAGELLAKMIGAMGLSREDVFICNVVKCRPPGNRAPSPEEASACWGYLVRQLGIIRPKVIVTLGNPATKALLDTKIGITKLRGQWQSLPAIGEGLEGTAVMPTFHPAYVLRQYTPENRGKVWSDLQAVMERLGLSTPTPGE
jgi:uracil-DNA glycosylase family 4